MTELQLDPVQARILGCLIEKERTTPDYYPLTLNALVTACNQKSNRDPVVEFDDVTVLKAIDSLKLKSVVMSVHPAGSRAAKYKHVLKEKLDWIDDEIAILCELMIRGPQTVGELRNRCDRLYAFTDIEDVRDTLVRLSKKLQPLVLELPRLPGQKEARWTHLLCGEPDLDQLAEQSTAAEPARAGIVAENERIDQLETDVETLKQQISELQQQFAQFKAQFE